MANGGTAEGERLQEIGGPDFCNRVSALLFDMNSNAAQTMLKMPRIHYTEIPLDAREYMERRFYTLIDACHIARFPGDLDAIIATNGKSVLQRSCRKQNLWEFRTSIECD
jgi:hypothetical protein